ncbi:MAG: BCCT family transporter [Bacteroidota bacterium]
MRALKHQVFWPPFLVLLSSAVYSFFDPDAFLEAVSQLNTLLLEYFGWLFSWSMFFFLLLCVIIYFSPIAHVRIGGREATPILNRWRWLSITLCTTVATGILFWGSAEPMYHLYQPPQNAGFEAATTEAAVFSVSTLLMHWTFTPYGVYALASLTFALAYYNLKQPFSLSALLYPLLGNAAKGRMGDFIDAICLYSLVAGMSASLGTGILMMAGGLDALAGIPQTPLLLGLVALTIVITFVLSAISGLMKGIRILSDWNFKLLVGFCIFILVFGPTLFIFEFGAKAIADYVVHFVPRSLAPVGNDTNWANAWTVFYWAVWLAWTPISALFLGRLAIGYTVREFLNTNLVFTSLFSLFWMMVFGSTAIHMDFVTESIDLYAVLQDGGPQNVMFAIFDYFPLAKWLGILFLVMSFLSFVTAADSNTTAMGGISSTGISPENPEPSIWIKLAWGGTIGVVAWVMVTFAGIDGIRMASNLGGLPALFLILAMSVGVIRLLLKPEPLLKDSIRQ